MRGGVHGFFVAKGGGFKSSTGFGPRGIFGGAPTEMFRTFGGTAFAGFQVFYHVSHDSHVPIEGLLVQVEK